MISYNFPSLQNWFTFEDREIPFAKSTEQEHYEEQDKYKMKRKEFKTNPIICDVSILPCHPIANLKVTLLIAQPFRSA